MYVYVWVNTIASERCIWLSLNLVCILQLTIRQTLLILINVLCYVFLQDYKKSLKHYVQSSQIFKIILASKQYIQLSSNFVSMLHVTVERNQFISVSVGFTDFVQEHKKEFLVYEVKLLKVFLCLNGSIDSAPIWYVY